MNFKKSIFSIFLIYFFCNSYAQNLPIKTIYPDTLLSKNDSIYLKNEFWDDLWAVKLINSDTLGTNGKQGNYLDIWTDNDKLTIQHVNFPYEQMVDIPVITSTDTILLTIRFQDNISAFSSSYVKSNTDKIDIQLPETFELANVILSLTDCSKKTGNQQDSEYANQVRDYFKPFKNHKLIQILDSKCSNGSSFDLYYGLRENSLCFHFDKDGYLQYDTPYKHVFWDDSNINGGYFRHFLYLIQDFAIKSNFHEFYNGNFSYYEKLVQRQNELLPVKEMWSWLEHEFPQKYESYKIIFSPLIGGSHSTQKYAKGYNETNFQECVMFISSSESLDSKNDYSEDLKKGLMSGIVFTEINHNYVNPTSAKNIESIKTLINNLDFWATKKAQKNYSNEYSIFNEYMTHALFCMYISDKYQGLEKEEIVTRRIKLMERRGFPQFAQFNSKLLNIVKEQSKTVFELYPEIIEEMKKIKE